MGSEVIMGAEATTDKGGYARQEISGGRLVEEGGAGLGSSIAAAKKKAEPGLSRIDPF
jgi:hypothetical protein